MTGMNTPPPISASGSSTIPAVQSWPLCRRSGLYTPLSIASIRILPYSCPLDSSHLVILARLRLRNDLPH